AAAARIDIPHDVAAAFLRRGDFYVHDRLEQRRLYLFHRIAESFAAGSAKTVFVGIDVVIRTIDQLDFEIDQWIAGDSAVGRGLDNSFLNRRPELLRYRASENRIFGNKSFTPSQTVADHFAAA